MSGWLRVALRVALSVGLLALLLISVDIRVTLNRLREADWQDFGIGLAIYQISVIGIGSARWRLLLEDLDQPPGLLQLIGLNWIGSLLSLALPTSFGGDLYRVFGLRSSVRATPAVVVSVLLDRLFGFASLALVGVSGALAVLWTTGRAPVGAFGATILACAFLMLLLAIANGWVKLPSLGWLLSVKWIERIRMHFVDAAVNIVTSRHAASALLVSVLAQLGVVAAVGIAGRALGLEVAPSYYLMLAPVALLASALPFSVGGLGVREGAFVLLFAEAGVVAANATALSLTFYAYMVLTGFTGGIVSIVTSAVHVARES